MWDFHIFLAEFMGTAMLILLGNGVVANVTLKKSGMLGGGSIQIGTAWALAVMIPACIFGAVSGAHFNPALSIGLALIGNLSWGLLPGYIISQMLGAIVGAFVVYLFFKDQFDATEDELTKRGCFCTTPAIPNLIRNIFCEAVGTYILVFSLLGFGNVIGAQKTGLNYIFVYGVIASIGLSLGGVTGYAINPARDLGPRIVHSLVKFKTPKGKSGWGYALVPVIGPIMGAILAALTYVSIPWQLS